MSRYRSYLPGKHFVVLVGLIATLAVLAPSLFVFSETFAQLVTQSVVVPRMYQPPPSRSELLSKYQSVPELLDFVYKKGFPPIKLEGRRFGRGFSFHRPSNTKYGPHQWLWDSCFHAMSLSHVNVTEALFEVLSLFEFQDPASGFLPEMTYWVDDPNQQGIAGAMYGYSRPEHTDITQMPMVMYPIQRIYDALVEIEKSAQIRSDEIQLSYQFLHAILPRAYAYLRYWMDSRDPDGNGLVSIVHPWESGLDASPLYDCVHCDVCGREDQPLPQRLYPKFIMLLYRYRHRCGWDLKCIFGLRKRFDVEDVAVNAVLAHGLYLISELASLVYLDDLSAKAIDNYKTLSKNIVATLWNPQTNQFESLGWSCDLMKKIRLRSRTVQSLFPLLLPDLPLDIRMQLISDLEDRSRFAARFPVPTTALSDPSFDPNDSALMWRGPSWPTTNWFVFRGLMESLRRNMLQKSQHADPDLEMRVYEAASRAAANLLQRWLEMHYLDGFHEYVNPQTGEGLGQAALGMSLSIADVLHELRAHYQNTDWSSLKGAMAFSINYDEVFERAAKETTAWQDKERPSLTQQSSMYLSAAEAFAQSRVGQQSQED